MTKATLIAAILCATPLAAAVAAPLSAQDKTFIDQAAIGGMAEVQGGQMAETKAQSPQVKQFGQHMIADHTPNNQELMQLAQSKGVTPPAGLDPMHQQEATKLQQLPAGQFDHAYIEGQVTDHQQMAALLQTEIQKGSDPQVKAFAEKTLPIIKEHLQMAQQLAAKA